MKGVSRAIRLTNLGGSGAGVNEDEMGYYEPGRMIASNCD